MQDYEELLPQVAEIRGFWHERFQYAKAIVQANGMKPKAKSKA